MKGVYKHLINRIGQGNQLFAVLVDPEKIEHPSQLIELSQKCNSNQVDLIFVGGSTVQEEIVDDIIDTLKTLTRIPVIIFPGSHQQISERADALLFLSLISGRNPEYLIGQQVAAASKLQHMNLEIIPTGYLLIDGGSPSSVLYVSQTQPIPRAKNEIALNTALAGEYMGMRVIYLDSGSGAKHTVHPNMISHLKKHLKLPLIVGGGIRTEHDLRKVRDAGADIIVVGNALEKEPSLIENFSKIIHRSQAIDI